ncbi:hypothetical protein AKJ56_01480 [candidate division MSBL1 archaeon SCGC-AAA382N08]|uniref:VTT domain-containing protein n=1 Tax=candidate division MSBL1 archaeon SCGC-AAA382N08 TaxID=1698285 RepID=A0A133VPL2_9EURY|nr:hypothetical protein AKJ56_01480 [candidate division MSBL1 archaeon SCGC-AAA382N08]
MPWWETFVALGYPGILVLNFLGASTIVFPVPYTAALLAAGASGYFNPLLLAVAAGLGSAAGEFVGYGAGYTGRRFIGEKYDRKFRAILTIFRRYGAPAIFLFALTPLPDDLLFVPLGLARYSFWKAFIPCVLGKFVMALVLVLFGSAAGRFFTQSWISALIVAVIFILVIYAIFRVDWVKVAEKYA